MSADYRYQKHYTRDQARALLPQIREWLDRLVRLRADFEKCENKLQPLLDKGNDTGGELINRWVRNVANIKDALMEFHQREIQIKDLDRGLIDFPAIIDGKEVFLCWEQEEDDIEFWHDLDAGYAGREKLD